MVWNAITTGNRDIALVEGKVGRFRPDIAPFAGMKEMNEENLDRLYAGLPKDSIVALSFPGRTQLDENKWKPVLQYPCCQMVYEAPVSSFTTPQSALIEPLGNEHIPQMLELTALTRPGPFLQNTILFGNYFGIFVDGRLAAMAGQRMHPVPYLEVSAVCTYPDFRGKGYARAVMLHVMKLIVDNSFIPFLHVLNTNTTAIQLYESIGFRVRRELFIDLVKRV